MTEIERAIDWIDAHREPTEICNHAYAKGAADLAVDIGERLVKAEAQVSELKRQIAELTWAEITPQNLPKVGDEVLRIHRKTGVIARLEAVEFDWTEGWMQKDDSRYGEYRRPLKQPNAKR